ncbi:MAG: VTT domain-containing protein [Bryobacterales bacterium]|nr:VTT domain-containing protein [Bryobacterales bacterium]
MPDLAAFLVKHGYLLLVAFVLLEQLGFPLPAAPMLIVAGALAASGHLHFGVAYLMGMGACLVADITWYVLGRRSGGRLLHLLCRFTLEPDDCLRRTADLYHRYGSFMLVIAKYVPGLNAIAAPLSGLLRLKLYKFLFFDMIGATLWVGGVLGAGYVFDNEVEQLGRWLQGLGSSVAILLIVAFAAYLSLKIWIRHRFVARLRAARIAPEEVWKHLRAGETFAVVDLRYGEEVDLVGAKVPGAIQILPEELSKRSGEIPRDRDIVLYCSCPNEATSARTAMRLQSRGIRRIRPLLGGFDGWVAAGLPVESVHSVKFPKRATPFFVKPGNISGVEAPVSASTD